MSGQMSEPRKQNDIITNQQLLYRLKRLSIVQRLTVPEVLAFLGLNLVNKGRPVKLQRAIKIIHTSNLDKQIEHNIHIPTNNILNAMIHLVIFKRQLFEYFLKHPDLPVWDDPDVSPLFDIMHEIAKVYRI